MASNNPYRSSMLPGEEEQRTPSPNSFIQPPPPALSRTPSPSPTIIAESLKAGTADHVLITIEPVASTAQSVTISEEEDYQPNSKLAVRQSIATLSGGCRRAEVRKSLQIEDGGHGDSEERNGTVWTNRRLLGKQRKMTKRKQMAIKIGVGVLILAGAVAIGLGISKAVHDAKNKE